MAKKRLTRSKKDKIVAGVLGGVAQYFDVDPTVVRIMWLIGMAFTGFVPGVIVYIIAAMIVPKSRTK